MSRRRSSPACVALGRRPASLTGAGAASLALALSAAGCGSGSGKETSAVKPATPVATVTAPADGGLSWVQAPLVFTPDGLPGDRILAGELRNDTGAPVELRVDRVKVTDATGHALKASVRFVAAYGHGLYGPGGPPAPLRASRFDQQRLGERLTLAPGAMRPVTLAWRLVKGRGPATQVRIGQLTLAVPAAKG